MRNLYQIGFTTQHGTSGTALVAAESSEAARVAVFDQWPGTLAIEFVAEAGTVLISGEGK